MREKARIYTCFVYACQSTKRGLGARSQYENGKGTTESMRSKSRANARYFHMINARGSPSNMHLAIASAAPTTGQCPPSFACADAQGFTLPLHPHQHSKPCQSQREDTDALANTDHAPLTSPDFLMSPARHTCCVACAPIHLASQLKCRQTIQWLCWCQHY